MSKLKIIGLEGQAVGVVVEVQFNPKEISVDKNVAWQVQSVSTADLEFTSAEPKTLAFELLFDGFQSGTSVQGEIDKLYLFSSWDPALKRPPRVKVSWGQEGAPGMMPAVQSVIESLGIKYTMFDPTGLPLRATVQLHLREARRAAVAKAAVRRAVGRS